MELFGYDNDVKVEHSETCRTCKPIRRRCLVTVGTCRARTCTPAHSSPTVDTEKKAVDNDQSRCSFLVLRETLEPR